MLGCRRYIIVRLARLAWAASGWARWLPIRYRTTNSGRCDEPLFTAEDFGRKAVIQRWLEVRAIRLMESAREMDGRRVG